MLTRRTKRSESFWPSILVKKWLNIKPKVHDFSEDEVDSESEDDDANNTGAGWLCESRTTVGNQTVSTTHASAETYGFSSRLQRRKSETLRVQYIRKRDVRVMIGTWNVAGRAPCDDLEIDGWLSTEEPADIYILGFQEVVPLNAGNVLGAEDSKPIPKWESIIRRTLNKSFQPQSKCKSYTAPPSPVLRASSPEDFHISNGDDSVLTNCNSRTFDLADGDKLLPEGAAVKAMSRTLQGKVTFVNGRVDKLDWPEYSLATPPRPFPSSASLRRVSSTSSEYCFSCMQESQIFPSQSSATVVGLKRVYHSSGNLGMIWAEKQVEPEAIDSIYDVIDKPSDKEEDLNSENIAEKCEDGDDRKCVRAHTKYVRIVSKQMVGIYISVWVSRRLRKYVNNLKVYPVGVGLMGFMGNKGSVSVSMSLFQTRVCFVCSHLTSGHKEGDQQRRNSNVHEILQRTQFSSIIDANQTLTIPSHDRIFWFGDLNYRLNMPDGKIRELVARKEWDELISRDQLCKEMQSGCVFDGWKEGPIDFPPTYKYEINSDIYFGEIARDGEKKRSPAWCDRILWLGKGVKQLSYQRAELKLSDHRPVSSTFLVEVEVFDHRKLRRVLNRSNAGL